MKGITLELVKTHLKYYTRNKSVIFSTLAFPLIFIAVFGIAFQFSDPTTDTMKIGIIVEDEGIPDNSTVMGFNRNLVSNTQISKDYVNLLGEITFENSNTKIFTVTRFETSKTEIAVDELNKREIIALIYIDYDFSIGFMAAIKSKFQYNQTITSMTNDWVNYPDIDYKTNLVVQGDMSLQTFAIASNVIDIVTDIYFNFGEPSGIGSEISIQGSVDSKGLTAFDYVLPGLVIYAIMNTVGVIAAVALRDVKSGLLDRLRISNVHPHKYTGSIIVGQFMISLIQIPIMFAAGIMFGFEFSPQIVIAFGLAILVSLSMSGIGLIIAGLSTTQEGAGSMAAMIATPMAFLASVFFIVPNPTIISKGGLLGNNELGIMDLLPPTSAIDALRLVLLGGKSVSDVGYYFVLLTILTMIYLIIGIYVYSRKHLKPV